MATSINPPFGAIPTNGAGDPFAGPPTGPLRFASFDTEQFSMYSTSSPSQAKRALEAHLKDTDRRIQDASRLGTTLLQQQRDLASRLKELEQVDQEEAVPAELRKKLAELEREYNEVGKESARAFLPKSKPLAEGDVNRGAPTVFSGQARDSPTKVPATSRKQRNQPTNRVHDIEFATEISTSLLAQVRQLQTALAEKDDALRETTSAKAQLEAEAVGMVQRIKHMDENEQHYKDENWNLETKLQDLETGHRDITDKHDRLTQSMKSMHSEKANSQRELDELRLSHEKLQEDHATVKKQQETDLNSLRRDVANYQAEKSRLQKKVEEVTAQNTELAKAVSSRWNQPSAATDSEFVSAAEDRDEDDMTPEHSLPASPVKGTPHHGMLESETLKSSLNHAHRMIQNLKNNIHREKTEKIELKRMLQDARDDLESRRNDTTGIGANAIKKRKNEPEGIKFKKPARPDRLGANRSSTTEVLEDEPDWEDHDGERTPSKSRFASGMAGAAAGIAGTSAFDHAAFNGDETESTDAFETANERDLTTETEAFETGNEGLPGDDSDEMTETEGSMARAGTIRAQRPSPLQNAKPGDRRSFQSTASNSGDEEEDHVRTPVQSQHPKYRLRLGRGGRRSGRVDDLRGDSPSLHSPTSSNGTPQPAGQSLGDELDALDDDSIEGTPSRMSEGAALSPETARQASMEPETPSRAVDGQGEPHAGVVESIEHDHEPEISSPVASPESNNHVDPEAKLAHQANAAMLAHEFTSKKPEMVDSGMMTEPWEPEKLDSAEPHKQTLRDRAGEMVGGALAGFGLGRLLPHHETEQDSVPQSQAKGTAEETVQPPKAAGAEERDVVPVPSEDTTSVAELPKAVPSPAAPTTTSPDASLPIDEPQTASEAVVAPMEGSKNLTSHTGPLMVALQQSEIMSQETEPIIPPAPLNVEKETDGSTAKTLSVLQEVTDAAATPSIPLVAAAPLAVHAAEQKPDLTFSAIDSQDFEPVAAPVSQRMPMVPRRSSRRPDALYGFGDPASDTEEPYGDAMPDATKDEPLPGTETSRPGAGFFASTMPPPPPPLIRSRSKSVPEGARPISTADKAVIEPRVFGGVRQGAGGIPTLVFGDEEDDGAREMPRMPFEGMTSSQTPVESFLSDERNIPVTQPLNVKKPMADGASQTMVSGEEIEDMMRNKSRTTSMTSDVGVSPMKPTSPGQRRSVDGAVTSDAAGNRGPRRPASVGSMRNKGGSGVPPPLPEDYTLKINQAQKTPGQHGTAWVSMGPPGMPASAYRLGGRPKTPADRALERSMSRDGTTPRPVRHRDSRGQMSGISRRSSVSSFASELDERFNITRGDLMYPSDVAPATDPRMIQAITQTMIGEYLWKYTRKAGRSETSNTRHRRFFWVHPYTRTLYWSEQDPSTAGRDMLKAKSVAIQAVRVITDDNTYPPGLHRKSLVVITPGREIVFTAPTGQRHETWFNALSYLLLRTEQEKGEANDTINEDDLEEFNPGFSIRRSISRMTGRDQSQSRRSLSSYNSRTTGRTSSPQRKGTGDSLAQRQSAAALRSPAATTTTPTPNATDGTTASRPNHARDTGSLSGRFSSLTSRFRPPSSQRGSSFSTRRGRSSMSIRGRNSGERSEIYDASVVEADSAEDLRAVIERQEREADRLENVRACCDGKHDVGSLSRKGRLSSMGSRFGGSQTHTHTHSHPKAEPLAESQRPRRGE